VGTAVPTTANLVSLVASKPAGTTFCLAAGSFVLNDKVVTKAGMTFIGAGFNRTFIRPSGINAPMTGFVGGSNDGTVPVTFAQLDIGGFTAAPSDTSCNNICGTAILNHGVPGRGGVILTDVVCHDNGTSCVGHGYGDVVATRIDCYANGFHPDSLLGDFRSSACIKLTEGSLVVRYSYVHDNAYDALWCDYCGNSHSLIENNTIIRNGRSGVHWEMSGQFVAGDNIVIRNNEIKSNGNNCAPTGSQLAAGILIEDASNVSISGNAFGGNGACEDAGLRAVNAYSGPRAPVTNISVSNNLLNGDRLGGPTQGPLCSRVSVTCSGNA
jgi:hypothetical protein